MSVSTEIHGVQADRGGSKLLSRLPSLDGWRAVSIVLVLGGHTIFTAGFPRELGSLFSWIFDANLGVRCFFLISGLLITWLLILEHDRTGRVNLGHFYARRALRILPVYFSFLLVIALLAHFTPYHLTGTEWIGNLTFTRNFMGTGFTTDHLWSLSVEEQFYILWPGLFVALGMTGNRNLLRLLAIPVFLAPLSRVIGHRPNLLFGGWLLHGYSFFTYFDSLAIGCVCAILLAHRRDWIEGWFTARPRAVFGTGLVLVGVIHVLDQFAAGSFLLRALLVAFGYSVQAFGIALLVLQSVLMPRWFVFRALNWGWVCRIGVLSYSIYIWQQIFCSKPQTFGMGNVWWMSCPGWLVPCVVVAFISYYGLERPFLKLRARFR